MKITFHSDRVFGQNLLRGDIKSDGPQIDHFDFINAGDDEEEAGTDSASLVSYQQSHERNLTIFDFLPSSVFQA